MQFEPTGLAGAWLVITDPFNDERGRFGRIYCKKEFAARGLTASLVQASLSFNHRRGTVRGMHFQWPPSQEAKLIRCVRGAVYDVIVDLRPDSRSYLQRFGVELAADNYRALYVPDGFAHGFQTLRDGSELLYQMTDYYEPELSAGYRYNDAAFEIDWPEPVTSVSDRDANAAAFDRNVHADEYRRRATRASGS